MRNAHKHCNCGRFSCYRLWITKYLQKMSSSSGDKAVDRFKNFNCVPSKFFTLRPRICFMEVLAKIINNLSGLGTATEFFLFFEIKGGHHMDELIIGVQAH